MTELNLFKNPITSYPLELDGENVLMLARDNLKISLVQDWSPGDDKLYIDATSLQLPLIPEVGYVTVYLKDASVIYASNRAVTLHYDGVDRDQLTLLNVESTSIEREIRPAGCDVVFNVVAAHHESSRSSVLALEHYMGTRRDPDAASIEYFTQQLTYNVKRPLPYFDNEPKVAVVGQNVKFYNLTFRLQPWQTITYLWEFGDGNTSDEENPTHVYDEAGEYEVTLTVTNDYGTRSTTIATAILIKGRPPEKGVVTASQPIIIAKETHITLSVENAPLQDDTEPIIDYLWDTGNGAVHERNAAITTTFKQGGFYNPAVKRITPSKAFRWDVLEKSLNVIERNSLWAIQSPSAASSRTIVDEYMTMTKSWKGNGEKTIFAKRITPLLQTNTTQVSNTTPQSEDMVNFDGSFIPDRTWYNDGALVEEIGTFKGHWFYSANQQDLQRVVYDSLTNSWSGGTSHASRLRGWGWQVSRLNWTGAPAELQPNDFYVMFGLFNPNDALSLENMFVDIFHVGTNTWESKPLPTSTIDTLVSHDRPVRWRISPWESEFYLWRATGETFKEGFIYRPLVDVWESLGIQQVSGLGDLSVSEGATATLTNGIFFFNHTGHINFFIPIAQSWSEIGGLKSALSNTSVWSDSSKHDAEDPNVPIKVCSRSWYPSANNFTAYVSAAYSSKANGEYSALLMTSTSLPSRPEGQLWATGVY